MLRVVVASLARSTVIGIVIGAASITGAPAALAGPDDPPPPPVTVNDFIPEDRDLGDCLSSLPKPDCGSDTRGGWHQTIVLVAILGGLAVIVWRVVAGARRGRREQVAAAARDRTHTDRTNGDETNADGPGVTPER